ncbi:MAG: hypothetical protein D6732_23925 [Methanobacteriota archaeon]|nr:MAG: hypothetical protein D6732_23925 [Euryarchaeota archaeon]
MNKKGKLIARMFHSSPQQIIEAIEKNHGSPDSRRVAMEEIIRQVATQNNDGALLDFATQLVEIENNWMTIEWKLANLEFIILNCKDDMFLFEILATIKNFINDVFQRADLTKDHYSQIYGILTIMARIFVEKKVYQTAIDLYKSMISIGKTFNIDQNFQLRGIYDSIELFELLEDINSVFEMAVLGHSMAEESSLPWKIAFERILEFSGYKLAMAYLNGAEALSWQSNDVGTKNFIINSLRAMSLLLRAKQRLTPEISQIVQKIIKVLSRTRNLTPDEIETIEVLELLKTSKLSSNQLLECANTFLNYCDIAFRPTVDVLLLIWNGTMIYSKSTKTLENDKRSTNIYSKDGQVMISALISAVSTSMKETLNESEDIKQIQHGSQTVLIETEKELSLFVIADRETVELRQEMQGFMADILVADFFRKFENRLVSLTEYAEFFDPFVKKRFERFMFIMPT